MNKLTIAMKLLPRGSGSQFKVPELPKGIEAAAAGKKGGSGPSSHNPIPKSTQKLPDVDKFKNFTRSLVSNKFATHLAGGTVTGLVAGMMVGKAGKTASLLSGSGIIIYQIAQHQGYVKPIDFEGAIKKTGAQKGALANSEALTKVTNFAKKNRVFTAGFVGGFLIGIVS